jgi:hypothetical protein
MENLKTCVVLLLLNNDLFGKQLRITNKDDHNSYTNHSFFAVVWRAV